LIGGGWSAYGCGGAERCLDRAFTSLIGGFGWKSLGYRAGFYLKMLFGVVVSLEPGVELVDLVFRLNSS
jgi:hypothetical protein